MENYFEPNQSHLTAFSIGELLNDRSPLPEDLIAPRILTPGGLLVFGGEPKVGKSDFLLTLLVHMAAGAPFLGMTPPRPLRIFYLQAELRYDYLRERLHHMVFDRSFLPLLRKNLCVTSNPKILLNTKGVETLQKTISRHFSEDSIDIIVTDPLHYFFDGNEGEANKNSYSDMLSLLYQRLDQLRHMLNPEAGIILTHPLYKDHKRKNQDPFSTLRDTGDLRKYYTSAMIMFRPDKKATTRQLVFDLRNSI